ncbi:MAG: hypothetical protein ACFFAN_20770 [Promethearchaeota archaeon]
MPRKPRSAPATEADPLDIYSTWDIRAARLFYYSFVIISIITILGIWITVFAEVPTEFWQRFWELDLGYQIGIIGGMITAHLIIIVFFYAMFRGGILRMCRWLFKNRLIAKKYEDYTTLRWLMGVTILGIYVTVIAVIIGVLTQNFLQWIIDTFLWMVKNITNIGIWILLIGVDILIVVLFFFFMFVIWNHGVYLVLRAVKRIEEEEEIDEEIRREKVKGMSEEERQREYRKTTGKIATYRGKETRGYKAWKRKMGV